MAIKKLLTIFIMLFFYGCGGRSQNNSSSIVQIGEADTPELLRALELRLKPSSILLPWEDQYNTAIIEEFSKDDFQTLFSMSIKEEDLARLQCPGFSVSNKVNKMKFYLTLLAAIAEAESDFKTNLRTMAPDGTANIGLFQMDVKAANIHTQNKLGVLTEADLALGTINSRVGAHVLKNQLSRKGPVIFRGDYYWEVLNPNRTSINHVVKYFHQHLDQLEFCP